MDILCSNTSTDNSIAKRIIFRRNLSVPMMVVYFFEEFWDGFMLDSRWCYEKRDDSSPFWEKNAIQMTMQQKLTFSTAIFISKVEKPFLQKWIISRDVFFGNSFQFLSELVLFRLISCFLLVLNGDGLLTYLARKRRM